MGAERVCIIGAGASGIAAAKTLHERGIPFDCLEKGSDIGGLWRYRNDNGQSAAYKSLHMNTSRDKMAYPDFPMANCSADFPHHSEVLAYFEDYVDHFGFRDTLSFRTEVVRVDPLGNGTYEVTVRELSSGDVRSSTYGAVIVANGHHWKPSRPAFPGVFDGEALHSSQYKTPEILKGKRVLIVGTGNSACDIACEAAWNASRTYLSSRTGAYIVPKYILGRPLDTFMSPLASYLPLWIQRRMFQLLMFLARGNQKQYGFPTPGYKFGSEHPTISSDLLGHVGHGRIQVKPGIDQLKAGQVRFSDGTEEEIDLIIYATGYQVSFPFFDTDFIQAKNNYLPLYLHIVPPTHPNLYFIGLIQPIGAVMPLVAHQAEWVVDLLQGKVGLPSQEEMHGAIRREDEKINARYTKSERHTMQVDFYPYLRALKREVKAGSHRQPAQRLSEESTFKHDSPSHRNGRSDRNGQRLEHRSLLPNGAKMAS